MTTWLHRQLRPRRDVAAGVVVIRDRDGVVSDADGDEPMAAVRDWWGLRSTYERDGRRRDASLAPLTLLVQGPVATEPLPWDIEQASAVVIDVRLPGPAPVRAALATLRGGDSERAIAAVEVGGGAVAVLAAVTGVTPASSMSVVDQLRLATRLVIRPSAGPVLALARPFIIDVVVAGLVSDPVVTAGLQQAWVDAVTDPSSSWASIFEAAQIEMAALFTAGLLAPVTTSTAPAWADAGARSPGADERIAALLVAPPQPFPPTDVAGWCATATWWGEIRAAVATVDHLRERAWSVWSDLDDAFLPWLREHFGAVLSSSARWPSALHRVAPFLARRMREGEAERALLVVLDGMGHAQWAHLRERLALHVVEEGSTFAMVPTYTTVSRQTIFAGDLPTSFPESLWDTSPERRRWQAFWAHEGLAVTEAPYHRVLGRFPHDRIDFGAARAVGVVVNAVDDLMHSSELLGDAQLLANIDVWADNGFLVDLVTRAADDGFEVWLTADHGNLECDPAGKVGGGLGIDAAGKRLLRYPNLTLRDAAREPGIVWDGIPGLPASCEPLRFAPGRTAYTNNRLSISHGGLSLDEVIVPLVRVAP